jgi:hypothetical protein
MKTRKCFNLKNKRKKCRKTRKKINMCIFPTMGGHIRNFANVQTNDCNINCGKAIKGNTEEYKFYKIIYSKIKFPKYIHNLKKFIPKLYKKETCENENKTYFVLDNIRNNIGKNPVTIDIKLGFKTALKFESGIVKYSRHTILDKFFSNSNKRGYRIEGITRNKTKETMDKIKNKSMLAIGNRKKYDLYNSELKFIINELLTKKDKQKCFNKLNKIYIEFVKPNSNASIKKKEYISFIGSSILIAKGDSDVVVKIIDFNHPIWDKMNNYSDRDKLMSLDNFTNGFKTLLDDFKQLI